MTVNIVGNAKIGFTVHLMNDGVPLRMGGTFRLKREAKALADRLAHWRLLAVVDTTNPSQGTLQSIAWAHGIESSDAKTRIRALRTDSGAWRVYDTNAILGRYGPRQTLHAAQRERVRLCNL